MSYAYAPTPKVDTEFLNQIAAEMGDGMPSPFVVKQYERQVEALLRTPNPEWVWVGRSALAALTWDSARALDVAVRAHRAVGANPQILANLAVSLSRLGEFSAALEFANAASKAAPLDLFAMRQEASALLMLGRWTEAVGAGERYVSFAADAVDEALAEEMVSRPRTYVELLARSGASEPQLQAELVEAWAVLRDARTRCPSLLVRAEEDPDTGAGMLVVRLSIVGDLERELRLGSALARRLCRLPDWDPTRLSVDFQYMQHQDADATA